MGEKRIEKYYGLLKVADAENRITQQIDHEKPLNTEFV